MTLTVQELKSKILTELNALYSTAESQSFFNLLAEDYLKMSRLDIVLNSSKEISAENLEYFDNATRRLKNYEPIQYILGNTEFFDMSFKVNEHVLIPRPETEGLIRWILEEEKEPQVIIDLCTGSGCIAVSLKSRLQDSNVDALDISAEALQVARENALSNHTSINFVETNVLTLEALTKTYDVIVSNPPYVRNLEKQKMQDNVLQHEPHLALFVDDENPLVFYKKIAILAKYNLRPKGSVYLEINEYLGKETAQLFKDSGFSNVELRQDIFRRDRMLRASID